MSMRIEKSKVTAIDVTYRTGKSRITVSDWLSVANQLQEACDAGMPTDTTVVIRDSRSGDGLLIGHTISAIHTIREPVS